MPAYMVIVLAFALLFYNTQHTADELSRSFSLSLSLSRSLSFALTYSLSFSHSHTINGTTHHEVNPLNSTGNLFITFEINQLHFFSSNHPVPLMRFLLLSHSQNIFINIAVHFPCRHIDIWCYNHMIFFIFHTTGYKWPLVTIQNEVASWLWFLWMIEAHGKVVFLLLLASGKGAFSHLQYIVGSYKNEKKILFCVAMTYSLGNKRNLWIFAF